MKTATIALLLALLSTVSATAQEEPEYRLELGGGVGVSSYQGDFSSNLLKGLKPMGSVVVKYKPNPRMAWAFNIGYTQLAGDAAKEKTYYPDITDAGVSFKTGLVDVGVRYEYNFWPFGTGREYYGAKPVTPFIAMGFGLAVASAKVSGYEPLNGKTTNVGLQMPLGMGVKIKLAQRLNMAVEWMFHITGGDKLDGIKDAYGIRSSGLFKNTDCFSTIGLTLTYDIWEKCKTCNNDRD